MVEVATKPSCLHCRAPLASDNENAICGPCVTRWRREHPREVLPERATKKVGSRPKPPSPPLPDLSATCEKGHVLQDTGSSRGGKCFECQRADKKVGKRYKPRIRYFFLPGLADEAFGMSLSELAASSGFNHESLRQYRYRGKRAPEWTARVLAVALGCSLDDLKWGGGREEG